MIHYPSSPPPTEIADKGYYYQQAQSPTIATFEPLGSHHQRQVHKGYISDTFDRTNRYSLSDIHQKSEENNHTRKWSSNLCDCCIDCSSCCCATVCPCILFSRIVSHIDPDTNTCCTRTYLSCCYCLLPCSVWIHAPYRKQLRNKYHLSARPCNDCCVTFWCPCCTLAQEWREIETRVQSNIKESPPIQRM